MIYILKVYSIHRSKDVIIQPLLDLTTQIPNLQSINNHFVKKIDFRACNGSMSGNNGDYDIFIDMIVVHQLQVRSLCGRFS